MITQISSLSQKAMLVGITIHAWQARKYDRKISIEVAEQHAIDFSGLRVSDERIEEVGDMIGWHIVPNETFPLLLLSSTHALGVDFARSSASGDELVGCIQVLIENLLVVVH